MRDFWVVFWGACALFLAVAGARARRREWRRLGRPGPTLDDEAVRRIIDEGVLDAEHDEPLDLAEIDEEERRFWDEDWDQAEEW